MNGAILWREPFEKLGVINGFSRRLGGVSSGKNQRFKFWIQSRRRF